MQYERILAAVAATPWMIEPGKGRAIAAFLSRKASGEDIPRAEIEAAMASKKAKGRPRAGAVALIPLYGVMTQRADMFTELSGLVSTEAVGRQVDEAAADPSVEAIVIDVDSPGGSVFGTDELASKVAAAAKGKKVIAVANATAASAAYYVASQASELVVTPSGMVGSIGVVLMHVDESEALKQSGQVVTVIATSEKKAAGVDPGPLTPAGRQHMEQVVAGYHDLFIKAVARGRNVSQTAVRDGFGQGGMELAAAAVRAGMADRVATLDEVLARYGVSAADLAPAADRGRFDIELRRRKMLMD